MFQEMYIKYLSMNEATAVAKANSTDERKFKVITRFDTKTFKAYSYVVPANLDKEETNQYIKDTDELYNRYVVNPYEFRSYVNNNTVRGYLKEWKAISMIMTLNGLFDEFNSNPDRMTVWLKNCLEMEGFGELDIYKIGEWIRENSNMS